MTVRDLISAAVSSLVGTAVAVLVIRWATERETNATNQPTPAP